MDTGRECFTKWGASRQRLKNIKLPVTLQDPQTLSWLSKKNSLAGHSEKNSTVFNGNNQVNTQVKVCINIQSLEWRIVLFHVYTGQFSEGPKQVGFFRIVSSWQFFSWFLQVCFIKYKSRRTSHQAWRRARQVSTASQSCKSVTSKGSLSFTAILREQQAMREELELNTVGKW